MTTPVLRLAGITKRFGEVLANDRIDLELAAGEVLGLLGENGAGKTTLMSVLFGHYVADAGSIAVAGPDGALRPLTPGSPRAALEAGIGMVHQHFTLADNLTALDNIVLGTERLLRPTSRRAQARRALEGLMARSGLRVDPEAPVRSLSVGERQRVEILKVLHRDARILILDEPTAVLTPQEADELFAVLRGLAAQGLAVVLISHKLAEILAITRRVIVLRGGRAVADVATSATSREELAELMVGRPVPPAVREPLEPGRPVLELAGVEVADARGRALVGDLSLMVREREVVGVAGVAGNGQAGLAGLLAGVLRARRGEVRLLGEDASTWGPPDLVRRGVARVPEDRHRDGVVGALSLWENLVLPDRRRLEFQRLGWLRRAAARARTRAAMAAYDVRAPGPDVPVRLLSGGNMQKLILARELERRPALVLADQPTRGLDVGAVAEVHRRLLDARARGAAILLISEDLDELLALSDRIAVMHRGRLREAGPAGGLTPQALGLMMGGHDAGAAAGAERARAA